MQASWICQPGCRAAKAVVETDFFCCFDLKDQKQLQVLCYSLIFTEVTSYSELAADLSGDVSDGSFYTNGPLNSLTMGL